MAYSAFESDSPEVFVVPFPQRAGKWAVSTGFGRQPRWRGDGKEIYYLTQAAVMAAEVRARGAQLEIGTPRELFASSDRRGTADFEVSRDGQRFLVNRGADTLSKPVVNMIVNWTAGRKKE